MAGERSSPTFRKTDVSRAIKAVASAGQKVLRVEIEPAGKITIVTSEASGASVAGSLDEWMARRGTR